MSAKNLKQTRALSMAQKGGSSNVVVVKPPSAKSPSTVSAKSVIVKAPSVKSVSIKSASVKSAKPASVKSASVKSAKSTSVKGSKPASVKSASVKSSKSTSVKGSKPASVKSASVKSAKSGKSVKGSAKGSSKGSGKSVEDISLEDVSVDDSYTEEVFFSSEGSSDDSSSDYAVQENPTAPVQTEQTFNVIESILPEGLVDIAPVIFNENHQTLTEDWYSTSFPTTVNTEIVDFAGIPDGVTQIDIDDNYLLNNAWYDQIVIPVARNWLWCKQSHLHALDLYRSRREHEKARTVRHAFKENRVAFGHVRKNLNPRRKNANQWLRFTLHQNEYAKIGEKFDNNFSETIAILKAMKAGGADFCADFNQDLKKMETYTLHVDYIRGLVLHAEVNNGATGADRDRLVEARQFAWTTWNATRKHFNCHLKTNRNDENAKNAREAIKHLLIAQRNTHSIRCLMRMLIKRTTYKQVYLTEQGRELTRVCTKHIDQASSAMQTIQDIGGCPCKAIVRRAEFKEEQFKNASEDIQNFFVNWENVSSNLYDENINPNKRKREANKISKEAAVVYRTYMRFGLQAEKAFAGDFAAEVLSNEIVEHGPRFKRECVDELRQVRFLLTPYYRRP